GGRDEQAGAAREGDEADAWPAALRLDELGGGLARGGEPVGIDVGGAHRAGGVEGEQDGGRGLRHRYGRLGPGRADGEQDQARCEERGRDLPGPPRTTWQSGADEGERGDAD